MASCPYCRIAHRWMDQILRSKSEYENIEIEIIDEVRHQEIANKYNYWYVPTYYVGETKIHEGATSKKNIQKVFEEALK